MMTEASGRFGRVRDNMLSGGPRQRTGDFLNEFQTMHRYT